MFLAKEKLKLVGYSRSEIQDITISMKLCYDKLVYNVGL